MKNKKVLFLIGLSLPLLIVGFYINKKYFAPWEKFTAATKQVKELSDSNKLKNGDIIFQTSLSNQSKAIQLATHSKYSHCGLIFHSDTGKIAWYVLEAVKTVRYTPLDKWICRGDGGHYVIKRVITDPPLSDLMLQDLKAIAEKSLGKQYDWYFEWSDDRIYCSELVWKAYYELTGLGIAELQNIRDLDLTNELVKAKMKERYGDKIPLDEKVITLASIFSSPMLTLVQEN